MERFFEVITEFKDNKINLPERSTEFSVGYDFEAIENCVVPGLIYQYWLNFKKKNKLSGCWEKYGAFYPSGNTFREVKPTLIRTGIKAKFPTDEGLFLFNRSSNPKNRGLVLANGVGVIESDYYDNETNEGEILFAFYSLKLFSTQIKKGDKIGQGVFMPYKITDNDDAKGTRRGGFGSTDE